MEEINEKSIFSHNIFPPFLLIVKCNPKSPHVSIFFKMVIHVLLSQTVDAYYRHATSSNYVGNVGVPLLCISALDDPLCTKEAIPWDECR